MSASSPTEDTPPPLPPRSPAASPVVASAASSFNNNNNNNNNSNQNGKNQTAVQQLAASTSSWQSVVSNAATANAQADAAAYEKSYIPAAAPTTATTTPNRGSGSDHHHHHHHHMNQTHQTPSSSSSSSSAVGNAFSAIKSSSSAISSPPQEAPWTRWSVEARLMDRLLPAEKRRRQELNLISIEKEKFLMNVPKSPAVNLMSPDDIPQVSPAQRHHNHQQQQQQSSEAENFLLRERVQLLESQLDMHRARGDKTAKKRRHLRVVADALQRRHIERLVHQYWNKWSVGLLRARAAASSATALEAAASRMVSAVQHQQRNGRKDDDDTAAANTTVMMTEAEQLEQQRQQRERERIWGLAASPQRGSGGGGGGAVDVSVNNESMMSARAQLSPYAKVNAAVAESVSLQRGCRDAATSPLSLRQQKQPDTAAEMKGTAQQRQHDGKQQPGVVVASPTSAVSDGVNNSTNNSSITNEQQQQQQQWREERREAEDEARAALERRIEQLTLRCMDQDHVIRTLFVELAAVGQELETREAFVTPEASSMLLRQSVDAPDHAQVRSVVSPWPRIPSQQRHYSESHLHNHYDSSGGNNGATTAAIPIGKLLAEEASERRDVIEEKREDFNSICTQQIHDGEDEL